MTELGELDAVAGDLIDFYEERGVQVIVLSEYGIVPVSRPVHPNRVLREAGLIAYRMELGREVIDIGGSEAFAMADHQIAHVYVRDPARVPEVKALLEAVPGVGEVLDEAGKREYGLDHERSGELVLLAEPDSWFTYYYWLDDDKAPDYARTVDIHRKPGYDPVELFLDPAIRIPPARPRVAARQEEARLPHADGRDPARRVAGAAARTAGSPTTRRRGRC